MLDGESRMKPIGEWNLHSVQVEPPARNAGSTDLAKSKVTNG